LDSRGWETTQTPPVQHCGDVGQARGGGGGGMEGRLQNLGGRPNAEGIKDPLPVKAESYHHFGEVVEQVMANLGRHHIIALFIVFSLYSRAFHDARGHWVKIMDNISRFY